MLGSGTPGASDDAANEPSFPFDESFAAAISNFRGSWRFSIALCGFFDEGLASVANARTLDSKAEIELFLLVWVRLGTSSVFDDSFAISTLAADSEASEAVSFDSIVDP